MMTKGLVTFDCLHSAMFPTPLPRLGESVLCTRCNKPVKVITAPHDYRWYCDTCKAGRQYGAAFVTMETKAATHALRRVGHRVILRDGDDDLRVIHHEPMPIDIPF
jgi:hypothetical protein